MLIHTFCEIFILLFHHFVDDMGIWYILWQFGIYFTVLVRWTRKNLAALLTTRRSSHTNESISRTELKNLLSRFEMRAVRTDHRNRSLSNRSGMY
jgi:ABC-type lipopolysaccharide export system ATPase subunit